MKKIVAFKYAKIDGTIDLGVPNDIVGKHGNDRDGGCEIIFDTSKNSIGINEKFSIYLFAEDVNDISYKMWKAYFETEPNRAKKDFNRLIEELKQINNR